MWRERPYPVDERHIRALTPIELGCGALIAHFTKGNLNIDVDLRAVITHTDFTNFWRQYMATFANLCQKEVLISTRPCTYRLGPVEWVSCTWDTTTGWGADIVGLPDRIVLEEYKKGLKLPTPGALYKVAELGKYFGQLSIPVYGPGNEESKSDVGRNRNPAPATHRLSWNRPVQPRSRANGSRTPITRTGSAVLSPMLPPVTVEQQRLDSMKRLAPSYMKAAVAVALVRNVRKVAGRVSYAAFAEAAGLTNGQFSPAASVLVDEKKVLRRSELGLELTVTDVILEGEADIGPLHLKSGQYNIVVVAEEFERLLNSNGSGTGDATKDQETKGGGEPPADAPTDHEGEHDDDAVAPSDIELTNSENEPDNLPTDLIRFDGGLPIIPTREISTEPVQGGFFPRPETSEQLLALLIDEPEAITRDTSLGEAISSRQQAKEEARRALKLLEECQDQLWSLLNQHDHRIRLLEELLTEESAEESAEAELVNADAEEADETEAGD